MHLNPRSILEQQLEGAASHSELARCCSLALELEHAAALEATELTSAL